MKQLKVLIYWVLDTTARAKWPHSLIHKASINKKGVSTFQHSGVAKNMRGVFRKWTPRTNISNIKISLNKFRFSLFLECFGEI